MCRLMLQKLIQSHFIMCRQTLQCIGVRTSLYSYRIFSTSTPSGSTNVVQGCLIIHGIKDATAMYAYNSSRIK